MKKITRRFSYAWIPGFVVGFSWDKYDQSLQVGLGIIVLNIKIWM